MGNEMRILEYRQSNTSPLKYHVELNSEEMKAFQSIKELVAAYLSVLVEENKQATRCED